MAKLLLAGYFGSGNLGDDAILRGFVSAIPDDYKFRVICGNPERLNRLHGYSGVGKTDLAKVREAIAECDALVFPGGSIFQDVTSVRSVAYYSSLVKDAKKASKKVIMLGQGVGPLNRWMGKRLAASAFQAADMICVRDAASVGALKELGIKGVPKVTADNAFLLPEPPRSEESSSFGVAGMKTIGVSARPFGKDKSKAVIKTFAEFVKLLSNNGYVPVMLALDEAEDAHIIQEIAKVHGGKVPELKGVSNPIQMQERISRMEAVVAMRLHAGILATTVGVPSYMVSYDPKVTAFANSLGYASPPSIQGLTADRLFNGFQTFIKDRERTATAIRAKREELAKAAQANIDALRACLE